MSKRSAIPQVAEFVSGGRKVVGAGVSAFEHWCVSQSCFARPERCSFWLFVLGMLNSNGWSNEEQDLVDSVDSVITAFDRANLVVLGERHWAREDSEFRLQLVRNPAFAQKVNDVAIEFANPRYQALLDRFINGQPVAAEELQHVWRDTTQPGAFDSPVYEEFLSAVRGVNAKLPPHERLRVLAADYPINWSTLSTPSELDGPMRGRDRSAATVIQEQVLDRKRKALVLFGSAHLYRNRPETIIDFLKEDSRAKCFIILPVGGPGLPAIITANAATAGEPSLLTLASSAVGRLRAADVLEFGTKRIKTLDGNPVFEDGEPVFIPVFDGDIKVGDLADACLYFGGAQTDFVQPPPELYDRTEYGKEVLRRRNILNLAMSPK
jgi:hypothetical protein